MDFKKISYGVIVVGVILFVFPQEVMISYGDEQITLWEGSVPASNGEFIMVTDTVGAGESHDLMFELWNDEGSPMNASAENRADPDAILFLVNGMSPTVQFFVEDADTYDILVTGILETTQDTTVRGSLHFFEHVPPDFFRDYPYRIYGVAISVIGVLLLAGLMLKER